MLILDLYHWIICLYFSSSSSDLVSIMSLVPACIMKRVLGLELLVVSSQAADISFRRPPGMHILFLVDVAIPQNSCSCSLTIESPMRHVSLSSISSLGRIFNLFEVEMGEMYLVLVRRAPFFTGVNFSYMDYITFTSCFIHIFTADLKFCIVVVV